MKKKYQVFVSSTYTDLAEERAAVIQSLLKNDCIPVGMEQFPASNMSQFDYIKLMLDDCDYFVLILGGRYGSLDKDGVGFTEKEYDYAIEHNIPVMRFVVKSTDELPSKNVEKDEPHKYSNFRNKVCGDNLVAFYSNIEDLKSAVIASLNHCIRDFPAVGWVRGDSVDKIQATSKNPDDIEPVVIGFFDH